MKTLATLAAFLYVLNTQAQLNLQWQSLRPDNLGLIIKGMLVDQRDPSGQTIYVGAYGGGVWKSTNGGSNFTQLSCLDNNAVYCFAQAPDGTIYFGTGATVLEGSSFYSEGFLGNGIYKIDASDQISHLASTETYGTTNSAWGCVYRIAINPLNNNEIIAATGKGLLMSKDAGNTWAEILVYGITAQQSCSDVKWGNNGRNIYASIGNYSSKLAVSNDGGLTWRRMVDPTNPGFPGTQGRIEIAVSDKNDSVAYASIATTAGSFYGVFRTKNAGATWDTITRGTISINPFTNNGQGWYDNAITVLPGTTDSIIFGGVNMYTWSPNTGVDSIGKLTINGVSDNIEMFGFYYSATSHNRMYVATNDGLFKSSNAFNGFPDISISPKINDINGASMIDIAVSLNGGDIIGRMSEVGTVRSTEIPRQFTQILKGFEGVCSYSILKPDAIFSAQSYGRLFRSISQPIHWQSIYDTVITVGGSSYPCNNTSFNAPFYTPFWLFETKDAWNTSDSVLYTASTNLFAGDSITAISKTNAMPYKYALPTSVNAGQTIKVPDPVKSRLIVSTYCGLFMTDNALAQDPKWFLLKNISGYCSWATATNDINTIYAGTNGGAVDKITNLNFINYDSLYGTGDTITTSTHKIVSSGRTIEGISVSKQNPNRILCTISGYSNNNNVYISNDGGSTWTSTLIGDTGTAVFTCVIDEIDDNKFIVGTDHGLYTSTDAGTTWQHDNSLCNLPVFRLKQMPFNEYGCPVLYAAVNGGGLYRSFTLTPAGCATISVIKNIEDNNGSTLHLYPNPTSGYLNVELNAMDGKPVAISVYDITGRLLHTETNSAIQSAFSINVSGLPKGIYLLSAKSDNYHHTAKFTIE